MPWHTLDIESENHVDALEVPGGVVLRSRSRHTRRHGTCCAESMVMIPGARLQRQAAAKYIMVAGDGE